MKKLLIECGKYLGVILLSVFLGFTFLYIAYLIPTNQMKENIKNSLDTLETEGLYPELIKGYPTKLDNFTDALLLNEAAFHNDFGTMSKVIEIYSNSKKEENLDDTILNLKYGVEHQYTQITSYGRYWHGSLIFLKPFLHFFNYQDIRVINGLIQCILLCFIIYLFIKKGLWKYGCAFLVALFLIHPVTMPFSIQYSPVFYITLLSMLTMFLFHHKLREKKRYALFFLGIGVLTSYFDLLTYPVTTFGIPLILYFILEQTKSFKNTICSILKFGLLWSFGYLAMWASKWFLSALLLNDLSILKSALNSILYRSGNEGYIGMEITRFDAILRNLNEISNPVFHISLKLGTIFYILRFIKTKFKTVKKNLLESIPFLLLAFIPIVWYFLIANHSYIHSFFTYKSLIILFFGIIVFLENLLKKEVKNEK